MLTHYQFQQWRLRLGWTKRRAALELGVSYPTVFNYERGVYPNGNPCKKVPKKIETRCYLLLQYYLK